jgi:hypothetical protein
MSVGKEGTHDIRLESDTTASPSTALELKLLRESTGRKHRRESRLQSFSTGQRIGPIAFADKDPRRDLVFSQNDWSGGALQALYPRKGTNYYAKSEHLDLRWENVVTLGMKKSADKELGFLFRNGGFENASTTGWGATGTALNIISTAPRTGTYHGRMVVDNVNDEVYYTLANPTAYQGKQITFGGYVRTVNGACQARVRIEDSAGGTNGNTTASTSYTSSSATHTVDGSASSLKLVIELSAYTSSDEVYFDDLYMIPTGGVVNVGKIAVLGTDLYTAFGRVVCKWDETNDKWDAVYIHGAAAATDIVQYNGNIYVAFGTDGDDAYVYGSSTSWTVSTLSGDAKFAYYFTVIRDVLWKSRKDEGSDHDQINFSTNPINGGSWGTEIAVGEAKNEITGLYNFRDRPTIGKEDGLYFYNRVANESFGAAADVYHITNQFSNQPSSDNFSRGAEWQGKLFTVASQQSFYVLDGNYGLFDITGLLWAPRLEDFGGRIRAFAPDPVQLWMLVDTPTTDTTVAKETWLMSLMPSYGGDTFSVHTIEKVNIGDIRCLSSDGTYLWALGRIYNSDAEDYEAVAYRWTLPTKTVAPAFDATPVIATSGSFDTSVWDGGLPDDDKAFISVQLFTKSSVLDAEHTIAVSFRIDRAASYTSLGTLSSSSGGDIQTLYFQGITTPISNAIGKAIQFRFTMATDDTVSPEIYAFALHATLRPERVRVWEYTVIVGDDHEQGITKAVALTRLRALEGQVYPIELTEDDDDDGTPAATTVQFITDRTERLFNDELNHPLRADQELWRIVLQEVTTS